MASKLPPPSPNPLTNLTFIDIATIVLVTLTTTMVGNGMYDLCFKAYSTLWSAALLDAARGQTEYEVEFPKPVRLSPYGDQNHYYMDTTTRTCYLMTYDGYRGLAVALPDCSVLRTKYAPDGPDASDSDNP